MKLTSIVFKNANLLKIYFTISSASHHLINVTRSVFLLEVLNPIFDNQSTLKDLDKFCFAYFGLQ